MDKGTCPVPGEDPEEKQREKQNPVKAKDVVKSIDVLSAVLDKLSPNSPEPSKKRCYVDDDCILTEENKRNGVKLICNTRGVCTPKIDSKPLHVVVGTKCLSNGIDEGIVCHMDATCKPYSQLGEECTVDAHCIYDLGVQPGRSLHSNWWPWREV